MGANVRAKGKRNRKVRTVCVRTIPSPAIRFWINLHIAVGRKVDDEFVIA